MGFVKGQSGNPNGRPVGSKNLFTAKQFQKAMKEVGKEKKINVLKYFIERALENDMVLIALMRKVLPDRAESQVEFESNQPACSTRTIVFRDIEPEEIERLNNAVDEQGAP